MAEQIADVILMVRPARFGFNPETAANNAFQHNDARLSAEEVSRKALAEFDGFVGQLRNAGIEVIVADDTPEPVKTDAVFPNNWVTFHEDGRVFTFPMFSPNRRLERSEAMLERLRARFAVHDRIRMEAAESDNRFLEGTGSMVLDRENRLVYACTSPRTDPELTREFARQTGYEPVLFRAVDQNGTEIYHTNVMMALGETFAVICLESIAGAEERELVADKLRSTGKEIIGISFEQMNAFAGNMLQVRSKDGRRFLVMSEQAYRALDERQIARIEAHTRILHAPLYTIETYGGGSARCMMAEIFLPEKTPAT